MFYVSELYGFSIVRPLQAAIAGRGDEAAWFLEDFSRLSRYLRDDEKCLPTVAAVRDFDPHAVFVPGNLVPDFFPGIKVELFHGFNARKRPDHKGHFRIRNFFDLYCTQGPDTTMPFKAMEKKYGFFEVAETGWPKMDPLFQEAVPPVLAGDGQRPVVLMTSTFTPRLSAAPILFDRVRRLAETGRWKWLVHFHPKMDPEVVAAYKSIQGEHLDYIETDDMIPFLKAADIMVSDTSSIISEFMLRIRPVVTLNNRRPWSGLVDIRKPEELEAAIEYGLSRPPDLMQAIRRYTDQIHPYRDGLSSIRVLSATDALIEKGRGHLKKKPFNIARRLEVRRRMGYYRP